MTDTRYVVLAVSCCAIHAACSWATGPWPISTVARSGATLPTFTSDTYLVSGFSATSGDQPFASVADDGSVAFSTYGLIGSQPRAATFIKQPGGSPLPWAVQGQATFSTPPGAITTPDTFRFAAEPVAGGRFSTNLVRFNPGSGSQVFAIQGGNAANPSLTARMGEKAPGMPDGTTFFGFSKPFSRRSEYTRFTASLEGPDVTAANNIALYSSSSGGLRPVARRGDSAPGGPAGATFGAFTILGGARANGGGYFFNRIEGPGLSSSNNFTLWQDDPDSGPLPVVIPNVTPVAPVPGAVFDGSILYATTKTANSLLFLSTITGGGVTPSNNAGLWRHTPGSAASQVARESQTVIAPTPLTRTLGNVTNGGSLAANTRGDVVFGSPTSDSLNPNLFSFLRVTPSQSQPEVIFDYSRAITGDPLGPGVRIASSFQPIMNEAGVVILPATLTGTGVTSANDSAILALTPNGLLSTIIREGDMIEYAPGITARAVSIPFMSGMGGLNDASFNDAGKFVFAARFDDGGEAILCSIVPAPAGVMALGGVILPVMRRRRRPAER